MTRKTTHNSTYPKVAVTWLIEGSCFYSALVQIDSLVLLKPSGSCKTLCVIGLPLDLDY